MMDHDWDAGSKGRKCGCRMCHRKHTMMFWTIVALLVIIIVLLAKQTRALKGVL